jgi:hypothetical protein
MTLDHQPSNTARLCDSYRFDNSLVMGAVSEARIHMKVHINGTIEQAAALGLSIGLAWTGFCAQAENG